MIECNVCEQKKEIERTREHFQGQTQGCEDCLGKAHQEKSRREEIRGEEKREEEKRKVRRRRERRIW